MGILENKDSIYREPKVTTSILANVPDWLHTMLQENVQRTDERRTSILVSSNNLANRFILERWGIRSSQRRRYKNLYGIIRKQCRAIFRNYLTRGKIVWNDHTGENSFGVFRYDEVRGNLILCFVPLGGHLDWKRISDEV
jgi:hypothetical protein